jgi:transcription elongation factor GreA
MARLEAELDDLVRVRRPGNVASIRAAKELGDLRENADYHAAREEQSFLEGRIQALEARIRAAVVVPAATDSSRVAMGSRVVVDGDGQRQAWTIVGSDESDPAAGRISHASPVGRALLGRSVGDIAVVQTPRGEISYRVVAIE